MERYYSRAFSEAASMFEEVKGNLPDDHAAGLMADRCRLYAESPPPEDWDGVEIMTTK
jgi:adenylate cyclase